MKIVSEWEWLMWHTMYRSFWSRWSWRRFRMKTDSSNGKAMCKVIIIAQHSLSLWRWIDSLDWSPFLLLLLLLDRSDSLSLSLWKKKLSLSFSFCNHCVLVMCRKVWQTWHDSRARLSLSLSLTTRHSLSLSLYPVRQQREWKVSKAHKMSIQRKKFLHSKLNVLKMQILKSFSEAIH